jgi:hypothetical protein
MRKRPSKIYATFLALAVVAIVELVPSAAKACGSGSGNVLAVVIAVVAPVAAADVTLTGYDLGTAVLNERASKGWATAEVAIAGPQMILGGFALAGSRTDDSLIVSGFYTLWMAALTGHGIITLATSPPSPPEPPGSDKPRPTPPPPSENLFSQTRWSVTPTLVPDARQSALVPGFAAAGTF